MKMGVPSKDSSVVLEGLMCTVYNFLMKMSVVVPIYLWGYFNCGIPWLIGLIIVLLMRQQWKDKGELRRKKAQAIALCIDTEVILAGVDELPNWVNFPDFERVDWLNRIFRHVWPYVNNYVKGLLKDSIEPGIQQRLAAYKLNGFRFRKMLLGSIPLVVGGVKFYDRNVDRNEIIVDMEIFYAGDCDISFSLGGIKGGIKDFQIRGILRVIMKPLITMIPLVGGIQVFFLKDPIIDFGLVGVADLLNMPGLSNILPRIITETIAGIMVMPNKLSVQLSDCDSTIAPKITEPEGVLRVHLVEAKNLMKKDVSVLGMGKSDPYAIVRVGCEEFRTQTINNNTNPQWDFWCERIMFETQGETLNLQLYDADNLSKKDVWLGSAAVDVGYVVAKGQVDLWLPLDGVTHGIVHIRMMWLNLSSVISDLTTALEETQLLGLTTMSSALLMVYIDSASNLPKTRHGSKPNPYVTLALGIKKHRTITQARTVNPVYEQGFTFLVSNPECDSLDIKIVDQKTGSELAQLAYNLTSLLEKLHLRVENHPFNLSIAGLESKLIMTLQLRILKYKEPTSPVGDGPGDDSDIFVSLPEEEQSGTARSKSVEPSPVRNQSSKESLHSTQSSNSMERQLTLEEVMTLANTTPSLDSLPTYLRKRLSSNTLSNGETFLGCIELTLHYNVKTQKLMVTIHRVANLPMKDPHNLPDPYVKMYLLPSHSKESKRKTEISKGNCNPFYEEKFEYLISEAELSWSQLEVSIVTRKGWLSSHNPVIGEVIINLKELDLSDVSTLWYDLQPVPSKDI